MERIKIITPSWLIEKRNDHSAGIRWLEKQGFAVLNTAFPKRPPSDREKARQIHEAFKDRQVDIILAQRGGSSSMRVLPHINFELIRKYPKVFAGFSDLSTLLNAIYERTGLITFHAPMVINLGNPSPFTARSFLNALCGFPEKNLFKGTPIKVLRAGAARGILKGGNLVTLSTLIGSRWEIDTAGAIVFLEDVDEKYHEIERYLTQWIHAGKFQGVKGLILGDFRGVDYRKVYSIVSDQMRVKFPVVHCPRIGHVIDKITLPVGAAATLDTRKKTLILKSP